MTYEDGIGDKSAQGCDEHDGDSVSTVGLESATPTTAEPAYRSVPVTWTAQTSKAR